MKKLFLALVFLISVFVEPAMAATQTTTAMPGSPLSNDPYCQDTMTARQTAANQFGASVSNIIKSSTAPTMNIGGLVQSCFSGIFSMDIMPILAMNLCGSAYNFFMQSKLGQEISSLQGQLSQGVTLPYGGGNVGLSGSTGLGVGGGSGSVGNIQGSGGFNSSGNLLSPSSSSIGGNYGFQGPSQTQQASGQGNTNFGNILNMMFK